MRVATAAVLCFRALVVDSESEPELNSFGSHLGLDSKFMNELKAQVDDQAEMNMLINYLGLDPCLKKTFERPEQLKNRSSLLTTAAWRAIEEACFGNSIQDTNQAITAFTQS